MDPDGDSEPSPAGQLRPSYAGEDVRPTSKKELAGWYSYAWAAEVFVVCGVGSIVPITMEQLARENGVLLNDRSQPCTAVASPAPGNSTEPTATSVDGNSQCVVSVLGLEINTASFAMYTFSLSVLMQAIVIITMSGAADHGRYRKSLLLAFAAIGAVATMLFLAVTPSIFALGAFLTIISNTCFGASFVLLNSFLPLLVRYHPDILASKSATVPNPDTPPRQSDEIDDFPSSTDGLLTASPALKPSPAALSPALALSSKLSANGLSIGYVAAIIMQLFIVLLVSSLGGTLFSLRLVLFAIGAWWLLFTLPAALFLRPRPGPPLASTVRSKTATLTTYISLGWRTLFQTITRARKLRDVLLFLGAWFLLSDAIATVSGTAVLFAKTELHMSASALASINLVVMLFGIGGALAWPRVAAHLSLSPTRAILLCLGLFELIPLYALLPYILPFHISFGLQQKWEVFPIAGVYGLVLGGLGSYCRAVFGELIPPGAEASFYALYAITDKGSSIFGPTVVGAISDATGEMRLAFWFLAALIAAPAPFLYFVDVDRGKAEGRKLADEVVAVGES